MFPIRNTASKVKETTSPLCLWPPESAHNGKGVKPPLLAFVPFLFRM